MLTKWTDEMLSAMAERLEDYHKLFGVFWQMSSISFTDDAKYCPTAMVYLKGRPKMVINKPWWDKQGPKTQKFVIVHECLHAMLAHGLRTGKDEVPNATFVQVNQAQDITINEMAESLFKIPRTDIDGWEKYCWVATCFKDDPTVKLHETFVYYLEKLAKNNKELDVMLLDMHGGEGESDEGDADDALDDADLDALFDTMTEEELAAMDRVIKNRGPGGQLAGYLERQAIKRRLSVKKLIKGMRSAASKMKPRDTFVTEGRRFASLSRDLLMPNEHDSKRGHDKFRIALCLDVSGSVAHLRPQFYEMRELFMREKDLLEVRSYVFADRIKEITTSEQTYNVGGGNAPFQLIEDELCRADKKTKKIPRYPDCVIVITDGQAGGVTPKHPGRWLWLMTEVNDTSVIPSKSRHYKMSDVVFD
jgi:predicted metal-dependent peptidase